MCQCNEQPQPIITRESSGGVLTKVNFEVPTLVNWSDTVADGLVLPTALNSDGSATVKLKYKKNGSTPTNTPHTLTHSFSLTNTELAAIGITSETKIKIDYEFQDPQNPSNRPNGYWYCWIEKWITIYGQVVQEMRCAWCEYPVRVMDAGDDSGA